jgi:hypothetical protein
MGGGGGGGGASAAALPPGCGEASIAATEAALAALLECCGGATRVLSPLPSSAWGSGWSSGGGGGGDPDAVSAWAEDSACRPPAAVAETPAPLRSAAHDILPAEAAVEGRTKQPSASVDGWRTLLLIEAQNATGSLSILLFNKNLHPNCLKYTVPSYYVEPYNSVWSSTSPMAALETRTAQSTQALPKSTRATIDTPDTDRIGGVGTPRREAKTNRRNRGQHGRRRRHKSNSIDDGSADTHPGTGSTNQKEL